MIRYALACENEDAFEGWFASSADYDAQERAGLVQCPVCGSFAVRKAPMAPAIARARDAAEIVDRLRAEVRERFEYVGDDFAKEARAMHEGESPERPIWGEANADDARALIEDGVRVAPLPTPLAPLPPKKLN